jgi:dynein heavy chain
VWAFTLRSLYERHKVLFTLMLAMKIDCHKGLISHDEFNAFIKGELVPALAAEYRNVVKF